MNILLHTNANEYARARRYKGEPNWNKTSISSPVPYTIDIPTAMETNRSTPEPLHADKTEHSVYEERRQGKAPRTDNLMKSNQHLIACTLWDRHTNMDTNLREHKRTRLVHQSKSSFRLVERTINLKPNQHLEYHMYTMESPFQHGHDLVDKPR